MKNKLELSFFNKTIEKKLEPKKVISQLKKENWKITDSTKKKLKKYKNNPDKIIQRFRKVHKKKYDYSKVNFLGLTKNIIVICKVHGEFQTTPKLHLGRDSRNVYKKRNPLGCVKCIVDKAIIDFQKVYGKKYDYSKIELRNKSFFMIIICPEHGEFKQTLARHMNGGHCPKC